MENAVKVEVWGELASFNRPEMKVERVSYDVMTPSAARGLLEAIYWKPQMRWVIDAIHVLQPIRFTHVRRNEVSSKIPSAAVSRAMKGDSSPLGLAVDDSSVRSQRAAVLLRDVRYGIVAHIEVVRADPGRDGDLANPLAKHLEMFRRRVVGGQCFHHPYLGTRECPAEFVLADGFRPCPPELAGVRDLGYMLHDIEFVPDPKGKVVESSSGTRCTAIPRFFRAEMRDGVIRVPALGKRAEVAS